MVDQAELYICRNRHTRDDLGPQVDGWRGEHSLWKRKGLQIIVKVLPLAAVEGVAALANAGDALLPGAGAAEVFSLSIGQEDICAAVETLCATLQPASQPGQGSKVYIARHRDN